MPPAPKPKQKRVKRPHSKTSRQRVMKQLDDICREITHWRDGRQCVLRHMDGRHCNQEIHWSHVVPQGKSGYLKHNLSNAFDTCATHNFMHRADETTYINWFVQTFGQLAFDMLVKAKLEAHEHKYKYSLVELEEMLAQYQVLYNYRFYVEPDLVDLVRQGYYGDIIKSAWEKA